jgi:hypothetical protein
VSVNAASIDAQTGDLLFVSVQDLNAHAAPGSYIEAEDAKNGFSRASRAHTGRTSAQAQPEQ